MGTVDDQVPPLTDEYLEPLLYSPFIVGVVVVANLIIVRNIVFTLGEAVHAGSPVAPSARRYAEANAVVDLEVSLVIMYSQ